MQTRSPLFDDLARVLTGALSAAGTMREEVEIRLRDQFARILAGMNLVEREEFEAVKAMAATAREEQELLQARLAALEVELAALRSAAAAAPAAIRDPDRDAGPETVG